MAGVILQDDDGIDCDDNSSSSSSKESFTPLKGKMISVHASNNL